MPAKIPRDSLGSYLRYVLQRRSLSALFYFLMGIGALFIITLAAYFMMQNIRMIFFVSLLLVLGTLTNSMNRFLPFTTGFELILMGVVLCSIAYNPVIGIMLGVISLAISEIFMMKFKLGILFSFIGIIVVAFISSFLRDADISGLGIFLTFLYDFIIIPGYYFTGSNPVKLAVFSATHILFNIWAFSKLAPHLLGLMV